MREEVSPSYVLFNKKGFFLVVNQHLRGHPDQIRKDHKKGSRRLPFFDAI
jgi:hypothetical protein